MDLDCEIYAVDSSKIYSCLNRLGWIVIRYLHEKNYVPKEDIEKRSYSVQLNMAIISEIIIELMKYFNGEDSYYKDYEIDEAPDLGHVLGFLHRVFTFIKSNENSEVYLDAEW